MELKVVCLNLWQGGNLFDNILDFLTKEDADILMLQEAYDSTDPATPINYHSIDVLREKLTYKYYDFAPAMLDIVPEGKVVSGNAIFSKYPLKPHEAVFFSNPFRERVAHDPKEFPTTPRNLQHVTVVLPAREINLFNFQGVWDLDGDNYSEQRRKMSETIIESIKDKNNVILAGDTNAKPTNKAMTAIEEHLNSVFGNELTTSFNMLRKDNPGYANAVVDMMFVSKNIKIQKRSCPQIDISDHLPLITTLVLN
jgi:endonuclease/exonuclease/phosphatase family metal-dependent hydrolase